MSGIHLNQVDQDCFVQEVAENVAEILYPRISRALRQGLPAYSSYTTARNAYNCPRRYFVPETREYCTRIVPEYPNQRTTFNFTHEPTPVTCYYGYEPSSNPRAPRQLIRTYGLVRPCRCTQCSPPPPPPQPKRLVVSQWAAKPEASAYDYIEPHTSSYDSADSMAAQHGSYMSLEAVPGWCGHQNFKHRTGSEEPGMPCLVERPAMRCICGGQVDGSSVNRVYSATSEKPATPTYVCTYWKKPEERRTWEQHVCGSECLSFSEPLSRSTINWPLPRGTFPSSGHRLCLTSYQPSRETVNQGSNEATPPGGSKLSLKLQLT